VTSDMHVERIQFPAQGEPDILLEGQLHAPAQANDPAGLAIVCHPDPRIGGTMDYPVVSAVAEALAGADIAALRFDFRGVGGSGGDLVGDAVAELRDAAGALNHLIQRFGAKPLFVAGYSFGALVALRVAEREHDVAGAAMIAIPQTYVSPDEPTTREFPRLFVIADSDQLSDPEWAVGFAARCTPPARTLRLPGANHFLWGREAVIADTVAGFLHGLLP